jgi:hypothetical protein
VDIPQPGLAPGPVHAGVHAHGFQPSATSMATIISYPGLDLHEQTTTPLASHGRYFAAQAWPGEPDPGNPGLPTSRTRQRRKVPGRNQVIRLDGRKRDDLAAITLIASLTEQAERCLPELVTNARLNEHTRDEIASALATSPDEAHLRFDPESPVADQRWPYNL